MQGFNYIGDTTMSGGVLVSVKNNARLKRLRDQQEALRKQSESFRKQVAQTESELREMDQRTAAISDVALLTTVSKQRQQLKDVLDTLEYRQQQAEGQLRQVAEQLESWNTNFAEWTFRRQQLITELPTSPDDGPGVSYMTALGQNEIRSRATVAAELKDIVFKLENFSK